jgi:hypothetical protein
MQLRLLGQILLAEPEGSAGGPQAAPAATESPDLLTVYGFGW